jgi:2'-5' RNA ligase
LIENEKPHKFSSVLAIIPNNISKKIIDWGNKYIKESDVYEEEGRENSPHVTVLYGIHSISPKEIINLFKNQKAFSCKLGKMSLFENEKYDVLKIEVNCPELHKINKFLRKNLEYTSSYNQYVPHATIVYAKKGKANKLVGNEDFKDIEFIVNKLVFSSKNGKKTTISLGEK